jgi:hypothetical protein
LSAGFLGAALLTSAGLLGQDLKLTIAAQQLLVPGQAALMDAGPLTWLGTVEELLGFGKGKQWRTA